MAVSIRAALMIGPVKYTLKFLKNWLTIQIASMIAVIVICLVFNFINRILLGVCINAMILLYGKKRNRFKVSNVMRGSNTMYNFKNFIDKKINVIYNGNNDKGVEGSSNGFVVFFILN